jgi:Novel STAND NTPase 1
MADERVSACIANNPYVGPRPFRSGEVFRGREADTRGLLDMLISSRVVLLHSPSGAGKTSLIQAAVIPSFNNRRFQICVQHKPQISALRLNEPEPDFPVRNRYVYSVVSGLISHLGLPPADLAATSLVEALAILEEGAESRKHQLLVFDQLEEALTLDPTDHEGQHEFFRQVGEALDDDRRWGLLSMREDYIGGLDRFLKLIPGRLRATYRLDFLSQESAIRAICDPAKERDVEVEADAAQKLVDDLRKIMVEGHDKTPKTRLGPYVEPVLLQVVCDRLWRKSCQDRGGDFRTISAADVDRLGRTDQALRRYYAEVVQEAAGSDLMTEHLLRKWIADKLITEEGFRSQQRGDPPVQDPGYALKILQDRYLIRSDERAGARWWELSHDRLIQPIIDNNTSWELKNLEPWQIAAINWRRSQQDDSYLLRGDAYRQARKSLARHATVTDTERQFMDRSADKQAQRAFVYRITLSVSLLAAMLIISAILNIVLIILFIVK